MSTGFYETFEGLSSTLKLGISTSQVAHFVDEKNLSTDQIDAIEKFLEYANKVKNESIINTCLKLSRLPLKAQKTFEGFDFDRLHGPKIEELKNITNLTPLYEQRNVAFIGVAGIGKTHLAMAFGRECCLRGIKAYFLKASELNDRLTMARRNDRVGSVINGLVKPSCLIIDEIGRCTFDKENTRLFFDIVDRRSAKEGPNCMVFTSNINPKEWKQFFNEDDALLCAMDRIYDNALVFMMYGTSFRGQHCETITVEAK